MASSSWDTGLKSANAGYARRVCGRYGTKSVTRPSGPAGVLSPAWLHRSTPSLKDGSATSSTRITIPSLPLTALFAVDCGQSCAGAFIGQVKGTVCAITDDGRTLTSLILGCSRWPRPIDRRANPDAETTDWRARRGKTAHRVRREGTAIAVSYPYPSTLSGPLTFPIPDVRWQRSGRPRMYRAAALVKLLVNAHARLFATYRRTPWRASAHFQISVQRRSVARWGRNLPNLSGVGLRTTANLRCATLQSSTRFPFGSR